MTRFFFLSTCALLSACTPSGHDGIAKSDAPDTWSIAQTGEDSLVLRERIYLQADQFCNAQNKYLQPVAKNYSESSYHLTFRCLSSGDPDFTGIDDESPEMRFKKKLGGYGTVKY